MLSRIRRGLIVSISVIALLFVSVVPSYPETTTYVYDELNRLIEVIYEDASGVIYTYDASGNRITLSSYPDTIPPTGTITINSGASQTCIPAVTLTLSCSDNVGCSQMQFSNDNVTYSNPEASGTTKSWTLSPGDGTKTVYAKFKDVAGNWSAAYSDTIELLTTDSYTKSLLHMNGTDGSTTFIDSGGAHTWTAHGNAQIDTAQSKFGGASGLFDGNGDYISSADSADWYLGTGDFTIDFWIRFNALPASGKYFLICSQFVSVTEVWYVAVRNNSGAYQLDFYSNTGAQNIRSLQNSSPNLTASIWYHLAIVRTGNTFKWFQGGTQVGSNVTDTDPVPNLAAALEVGRWAYSSNYYYFNGWLDEFRISKGIARWTSNFTPPTSEYCP